MSSYTLAPNIKSITAGTVAVSLNPTATTSVTIRVTEFTLQNQSTATVYLGGSAVTAAAGAGLQIAAAASVSFDRETLRTGSQTYDPSNYWVVSGATGSTLVLFYNYDH